MGPVSKKNKGLFVTLESGLLFWSLFSEKEDREFIGPNFQMQLVLELLQMVASLIKSSTKSNFVS